MEYYLACQCCLPRIPFSPIFHGLFHMVSVSSIWCIYSLQEGNEKVPAIKSLPRNIQFRLRMQTKFH